MDTREEAADYDAMDHSVVNERFVDDLLAAREPAESIEESWEVVDLGCGTAQLPIALCERCGAARVLAADLSIEMLEIARYNIEAAGLIEQIQLAHLDAKQSELDDDAFDAVISNSIIHHIPDPIVVLREAVRVAKPGGLLFFRDLMRPHDKGALESLVAQYAGDESEHARQMFGDSLHAALSLEEIQEMAEKLGFAADTAVATSDRHWTWTARKS